MRRARCAAHRPATARRSRISTAAASTAAPPPWAPCARPPRRGGAVLTAAAAGGGDGVSALLQGLVSELRSDPSLAPLLDDPKVTVAPLHAAFA